MKRIYESPVMFAEVFVANQYVAACGEIINQVNPMTVRCQSKGHTNQARDTIFIDNTSCEGKYDPSLTDDKCHYTHGGASGTGFVKGYWSTMRNNWFVETPEGTETAYKGYFAQGGHRHLFYATTEQAEEFQGS